MRRGLPRDRQTLAFHWLVLASSALAVSGALSLGVILARVPVVARHLSDTDLARRFLVVHVGLGVVVWFSALPVALLHLQRLAAGWSRPVPWLRASAPWLSTVGALALLVGLVPGLGSVHLANYVPVVAHPVYAVGLGMLFAGVASSYIDAGVVTTSDRPLLPARLAPRFRVPDAVTATLAAAGPLVAVGAVYVLLAVSSMGSALGRLPAGLGEGDRLELLMWGPGHLLQLANVAFVLLAWALLGAWGTGRRTSKGLRWAVLALLVPVLPSLVLLVRGPMWWFSRAGFVLLMQWGLFPAVLVFLAFAVLPHFVTERRRSPAPSRESDGPSRDALWPLAASIVLMLVGFLYGASIRGSDLRIPGHYHACIGAVTLAYMALALLLAGGGSRARGRSSVLRRVAVIYGVGQLLFSTGLVLAGSYGLGRKTYGIEQQLGGDGQKMGIWIAAAGGALAFAGGAVWAVAMARRLRGAEAPLVAPPE